MKKTHRIGRWLLIISAVCGCLFAASLWGGGGSTRAAPSQLTQQILPIECILTTVTIGTGQQVTAQCPTNTPVVTEIVTTPSGNRLIRGVVNESNLALLRLTFNSVVYTAGTAHSPLVITGDTWTFFIDAILPLVGGGTYTIYVEAVTVDGQVHSVTEVVTVPSLPSTTPDPHWPPIPPPNTSGATGMIGGGLLPGNVTPPAGSPPRIETDFFGTTRIWIDNGSEQPKLLYQRMGVAAQSLLIGAAVSGLTVLAIGVIAAINFIKRKRQ